MLIFPVNDDLASVKRHYPDLSYTAWVTENIVCSGRELTLNPFLDRVTALLLTFSCR